MHKLRALVTDSLSKTQRSFVGKKFTFKSSFYDSANTIQYYISVNPNRRLQKNPTSIERLSYDQFYYYILNYHFTEGDKILHIDNIFGEEVNTIKIINQLSDDNWADFIKGSEYYIQEQTKYYMDIIEVTRQGERPEPYGGPHGPRPGDRAGLHRPRPFTFYKAFQYCLNLNYKSK